MQFLSFFVGLALASIIYAILSPLTPSESYTNTLNVNDQFALNYVMYWKLLSGGEIQFEVHCKTTGWVGIGWSTGGGMIGADIYIGWVANGVAKMKVIFFNIKFGNKINRELIFRTSMPLLKSLQSQIQVKM